VGGYFLRYSIISMPKHYGDKKKGKSNPHAGRMTPAQHKKFTKAVKDGVITKGQHDKLSAGLLEAIIKKNQKAQQSKGRKGKK